MRFLFTIIAGALGAAQLHQATFDRLKSITPKDSAPKMWLTKQAELVLLRLANTEGLTEQTFRAFENFVTSTMHHSSEGNIQAVANLLERVRTQLDLAIEYESHEFFMMALALRLYDSLGVNIFERFQGLMVSEQRQKIMARLVMRLQAHGLVKFENSLNVGVCDRVGQLLQRVLQLDTDELELYTSSLEAAEREMNRLTRASQADVRFTLIPNAVGFLYCVPRLAPDTKTDRLERLRTLSNRENFAMFEAIAVDWARTLREASFITPRQNEEGNRPWRTPNLRLIELRLLPLALMSQHLLENEHDIPWMMCLKNFLETYTLADAYLKQNPGTPLLPFTWSEIAVFNQSMWSVLRFITGTFGALDVERESAKLAAFAAALRAGYPIEAGVAVVAPEARIPPIPSVHASQIRIFHTMNVLAHKFPATESFMRGIAALIHQRPFAPASHYYWLEAYLRELEIPSHAAGHPQWDLVGVCGIAHRFGVNIVEHVANDADTIRLTKHVCDLVRYIPGSPARWLAGNDPWLRHFTPIVSQHWRAMREFQTRPFGMSENVSGFLPNAILTGQAYGPKTYMPFISWYYSHNSALRGEVALKGLSVNGISMPESIITRMAQLSDPVRMFQPFVAFYEEIYRNNFNNPLTRTLVQRGLYLCKDAFITFVALKNVPETHKAVAQEYMESMWGLLKEFALAAELSVPVVNARHPSLAVLRKVAGEVARNLNTAKKNLPHAESTYARDEAAWKGNQAPTDEAVETFVARMKRFLVNNREFIKTIKNAATALSS